jgi:hypothetical protein
MQIPCPSIGLFKPFRAKSNSTTLKSLTSIRWCQGIKLGWLFPCANCSSYTQNQHPQDGVGIPDWLSRKGQKILCFIS